jgi:glycosyltransferase involved in cell wall biosynthesis
VVTLNSEGLIVHRTFRALQAAIEPVLEQGLSVQIVAVLDKVTDPVLMEMVEKWSLILDGILTAHRAEFGALSLSRNFGISKSNGEFISILDGDDLYGRHWLLRAYQACSSDHRTVAHPEVCYSFPLEPFLRYHFNGNQVPMELLNANQWSALLMAHRDIFEKIPYVLDDQNFAYQDWLWNCETNAQGYRHVLVPNTLMAIRQKPHGKSLWQNSHAMRKVVRPNTLFRNFYLLKYSPDFQYSESISSPAGWTKQLKQAIRNLFAPILLYPLDYLHVHHEGLFQQIVQLKRTVFSRFKYLVNKQAVPDWVKAELGELAKIEPNLRNYRKAQIRKKRPENRLNRAITPAMATLVREKAARVFIIDGLKDNPETLAALGYLLCSNTRHFIVTTEKGKNRWQKFLPDGSVHIDIGNADLFFEEKLILLHRLILESDLDYLHVFGSKLGLEMVTRYHATFAGVKNFASFFLSDFAIKEGEVVWQHRNYGDMLNTLDGVSTDTKIVRDYLLMVYGLPHELVHHHDMPYIGDHLPSAGNDVDCPRMSDQTAKRFQNQVRSLNARLKSERADKTVEKKLAEIFADSMKGYKSASDSYEKSDTVQQAIRTYHRDVFIEQVSKFYQAENVEP